MGARDDEHDLSKEPLLRAADPPVDPSERKAERILKRETERPDALVPGADSVYDEPDILPGRQGDVIEQDWSCGECGYNLRGLVPGHRCPECGHIELYRPPPPDADSYRARLRNRLAGVSPVRGWSVAILALLLGGPFAVVGAFMQSSPSLLAAGGMIMIVVFGPAIEETLKIAIAAMVIERRPYLFQRAEQIQLATVGSAFVFAVIENIIYLTVYIPNPNFAIIVWRWTICVGLHVGCTAIASKGLLDIWHRSITEQRKPDMGVGLRALVWAIVVHGLYNASVVAYEMIGSPFS